MTGQSVDPEGEHPAEETPEVSGTREALKKPHSRRI